MVYIGLRVLRFLDSGILGFWICPGTFGAWVPHFRVSELGFRGFGLWFLGVDTSAEGVLFSGG